jgi:hypothetical protein
MQKFASRLDKTRVVERLIHPTKGDPTDFLIDIHFMTNYRDAQLRTFAEYHQLLSASYFGRRA